MDVSLAVYTYEGLAGSSPVLPRCMWYTFTCVYSDQFVTIHMTYAGWTVCVQDDTSQVRYRAAPVKHAYSDDVMQPGLTDFYYYFRI